MQKIAIVILNYNGKKYLEQFLPFVVKYNSTESKIIVGDNGSTDDSVPFLEEAYPDIEIIKLQKNEGFSKGYNLVLQQVTAQYYILLNSDVEVTPNWIEPVISLMESDTSIAACQPKILSYFQRDTFEHAGAAGGFIDKLGYPFCRGRILNTVEKDIGQYDDEKQIFWATGACLFIRAEIFHKFKGFDDHFFAHMEEIDLCWRINAAGYKIFYTGKSKVFHIGGGTLPKTNSRKTFLNFRNSLFMLHKNVGPIHKNKELYLRLFFDKLALLHFFTFGQFKNGLAIFRAYLSYLKYSKKLYKTTGKAASKIPFSKLPIYNGLIIVDYYFKNNKKYSSLN